MYSELFFAKIKMAAAFQILGNDAMYSLMKSELNDVVKRPYQNSLDYPFNLTATLITSTQVYRYFFPPTITCNG